MKKLFMFLAVAGLATFGASCSSDDNSDEPVKVEAGQLAVKADKTEINVGDSVKFSVTLDGKEEKGSELFIGDEQIYTPHKFEKAGEFEVVAKKKGAKDSAAVKITVKGEGEEVPGDKKTLVLTPDKLEVFVGGEVKFTVTDGEAAVSGVKITQVGGAALTSDVWKADKVGTAKFVAEKEGYGKSNEVSVVVAEDKAPNKLVLTIVNLNDLNEGTPISVEVKDQNGNLVENSVFHILKQEFVMKSGRLNLTGAPAGSYEVYATFEELKSDVQTIVVKSGGKPVVSGTFTYGDITEPVLEEYIGVSEIIELSDGSKAARWISQTITKSYTIQHSFASFVTVDANGAIVDNGLKGEVVATNIGYFFNDKAGQLDKLQIEGNKVAESAKMVINYKTLGKNGAFEKVDVTSSAITVSGKTAKIVVKGDAKIAEWKKDGNANGLRKIDKSVIKLRVIE